MVVVQTGGRIHAGFLNLSLAHPRLYGGVGIGLDRPRLAVSVEPAGEISCDLEMARPYLERAVTALGVDGAHLSVQTSFARHVGLGSGTQLALASLLGVAEAYDITISPRAYAPTVGRGGRSGVGVATFEGGGFVVDAGHPTTRFTTQPPEPGAWEVPDPMVHRGLPDDWRFLLVTPRTDQQGPSGTTEDQRMRTIVEQADPGIADDIALLLVRRLLPAVATEDLASFGRAIARLGRLNGTWYADEQGGVYRPPAGQLIESLSQSEAVVSAGQSSWGPTVYGVTDSERADNARNAAEIALAEAGLEGEIRLARASAEGAVVRTD